MPTPGKQNRDDVSHLFDHVIVAQVADGKDPKDLNRLLSWREMRAVVEIWIERRKRRIQAADRTPTAQWVAGKLHIRHTDGQKLICEATGVPYVPPLTPKEQVEKLERQLDVIYSERAELAAFVAARWLLVSVLCRNDEKWPDYTVLYINGPTGQITWHVKDDDLPFFAHVPVVVPDSAAARMLAVWDGHDTEEKRRRLRALTELELGHSAAAKTA